MILFSIRKNKTVLSGTIRLERAIKKNVKKFQKTLDEDGLGCYTCQATFERDKQTSQKNMWRGIEVVITRRS